MQDFLSRIRSAEDTQELWDIFVAYFRSQGIERFYARHFPPAGAPDSERRIGNAYGYPPDFTQRYFGSELWELDAIPLHARNHPTPFYWWDVVKLRKLPSEEMQQLLEFKAMGIGNGLAIPVFGPHGRNGLVGVELPSDRERFSDEEVHDFQVFAQMTHQRFCELFDPSHAEPVTLSPREGEILTWVARGKSNSIIGDILGISPNTVDTHLRRIYEKLDVADRTTAAIRGIGCGLIRP
jgi:LuxR family transcriptional regulator/LuxR family quorum-sensing system transcriptional regulator CciR